ncbi:MFS transporter [Ammoniphilus resinae]|uniref:MFS family permease n=1 Tax=Ammoniphilus resinae TaxID=861532 RepID=A0ABS4GN00_9BACL|nr:MFS family permease [Ammoniphilus resinae]
MNEIETKQKSSSIYWIIVAITFLTLLISAGVRSTPGILIVPLEESLGWERSAVTFPLAINLILYGLCGPFAAALMERYGVKPIMVFALLLLSIGTGVSSFMTAEWHMTLLWGLVVGLGAGLTSSVLGAVIANKWFKERRGFIVGIFTASGATGQLIFLPLFAKIVSEYQWQAVVWVTSIASLVLVLLVFGFMRNKPSDVGRLPYGADETVGIEDSPAPANSGIFTVAWAGLKLGVRSKEFWLLAISFFVCGLSTNGLIGTHFIPACIDVGIPEVRAAGMLAVMGIFDIAGTLASGWFTDRWDSRWLLFWYYGLRGLSLMLFPFALGDSNFYFILFIVFYGLDWVATVPPTVRLCNDKFGKQSGVVFGWIWASHQLGAATAAYGGGLLYSLFGDYELAFLLAGISCLVASGLVINIRKRTNSVVVHQA